MRTTLVSALATKVRLRGHFDNSDFISDAALIDFIDSAYSEVYDTLVLKWEDYFSTETTIALVSGTNSYALPADFYKSLGVDVLIGGQYYNLRRYHINERNILNNGYSYSGRLHMYKLTGNNITFIPDVSTPDTIRLIYIPDITPITALTDSITLFSGWEELVVLYALRRCLVREETSTTSVDAEIMRQTKRLIEAADARDVAEPTVITDINTTDWQR